MPYFKWIAIDISGVLYSGKEFSRSIDYIEENFLHKGLAVISIKRLNRFLWNKVSISQKYDFFHNLFILLDSGVKLPNALEIVIAQTKSFLFKEVLIDVYDAVLEGTDFYSALAFHNDVFNDFEIALIQSGQHSGNLQRAVLLLVQYYSFKQKFLASLKSAVFTPILTFIFFIFIASLLLIFVIPKFQMIFASYQAQLPNITRIVLGASDFVQSPKFIYASILLCILTIIFSQFLQLPTFQKYKDYFMLKIPFFSDFILHSNLVNFLSALSVLLKGGVALPSAIAVSSEAISNIIIKNQVLDISVQVQEGRSFSDAINKSIFGFPDLKAIIVVGQESGNLESSITKAADIYQKSLQQKINFFVKIIQPLLLIILGLLISTLIFAIYVPVFTISSIAG